MLAVSGAYYSRVFSTRFLFLGVRLMVLRRAGERDACVLPLLPFAVCAGGAARES